MPRAVTGVVVTRNDAETVNIQIGLIGHTRRISELLDTSFFDVDHIRHRARIAWLRGGFSSPSAAYFAFANNQGAGIEARFGNITLLSAAVDTPGVRMLMFQINDGPFAGQSHGVPILVSQLGEDMGDESVIIPDIVGLWRKGGFKSLSQAAQDAIAAASFWI